MSKNSLRFTTFMMMMVIIFSVAVAPGIAAENESDEAPMPEVQYVQQTVPGPGKTGSYCYTILTIYYDEYNGEILHTTSQQVPHNMIYVGASGVNYKCSTKLYLPIWSCPYKK